MNMGEIVEIGVEHQSCCTEFQGIEKTHKNSTGIKILDLDNDYSKIEIKQTQHSTKSKSFKFRQ